MIRAPQATQRPQSAALILCSIVLLAHGAASAQAPVQPLARPNRLAMTLGVGLGSASLSSYHSAVDAIRASVLRQNPGWSMDGDLKSNLALSVELAFRYYFPFHVLAQVGFGALYNWSSATMRQGSFASSIESHNLLLEVPILVGGYHTFLDRIYAYGAVGPSVIVFSRAYWDPGTDFEADSAVGMHLLGGLDYLLAEHFAVGLELRYRLQNTKTIKVKGTNAIVTSGQLKGDGTGQTYDLNFSGVTVLFNVRIFAI